MQYNTKCELDDLKGLSKKWFFISIEAWIYTLLGMGYSLIAASMVLMITSFSVSLIIPMIVFALMFLPLLFLRIKFQLRIIKYLRYLKKGTYQNAELTFIEDANNSMRFYIGNTYRYIFHIKYDNKVSKCKVICTKVRPGILRLREKNGLYILQEKTQIPIVVYKGKVVVLQNDCGFYDIAHDDTPIKNISKYW